ncbi:hypothetical protein BDB00DRAFT_877145 [Zychaea mexicana]|uniref:uncharacterized protein n=1 Tax=Zychaea mexicana TaxID=64656 RepID=UPI0022FF02D2|nr:uncharacterized protein BDB00DRAFT_877145 [Zychaea mexicana]KAI9488676.1 hypothetical protein BDB00DRAFT_877145 [Zychaea mexicana]
MAAPSQPTDKANMDSLVYLEEMFQQYGHEDGMRDGKDSGVLEGRIFGCEKSFELGREIGFYDGCAKTWRELAERHQDKISSRVLKNIQALEKMVDEFPRDNCPNTDMFAARDKMAAKMKVIASLLGVNQKFNMEKRSELIY